jgi:hypothetical protein
MKDQSNRLDVRSRLIHAAVGAWLFSGAQAPKLKGTSTQVAAAAAVANATKAFKECLDRDDATLVEVSELLHKKHLAAERFKQEFGIDWLL